ncbi:MAG: hypothetical protein KF725_04230 [Cyclobacteriaceae bacterium]|nr:hypothetical protein [Cyclobacteriaceae bacterium]UYN85690.1 MAG: hypothetical protein KIT51_12510 [Cyclobacteriaceae bacterium]
MVLRTLFFSACLFSAVWVYANTEVKHFSIELAGLKIGELTATRKTIDTLTHYYIESKVSFWLFMKVNVHHVQTAVYHRNKLLSSTVKTRSNRGDFSSSVIWDNRQYVVKVDMYKYKHDGVIGSPINFNVMRFFFDEPTHVSSVLADGNGLMAPVAFVKKSYYEVNVRGERNKYFFKEGKLQRAVMDNSIKNYEIVLRTD